MTVPAILLAAGGSKRLGQPKQLVRWQGELLLERSIRAAVESGAEPVLLVLGAHREAIAAGVDLDPVRVVINPDWSQGIATSIRAGIEALQESPSLIDSVMMLVCDQPWLSADHLRRLITTYEEARRGQIAASEYGGTVGIPAIFPAAEFGRLLELQGDTGARAILRDARSRAILVRFEGGEVDIDTPRDLVEGAEP